MLQSANEKLLVTEYKGPAKSVSLKTAGGVYWLSWLAGWALPTLRAAARYRLDIGRYRLYIDCCKSLTPLTDAFL